MPGDSAPVVPNWLPVEMLPMLDTWTVLPMAPSAPAPLISSATAAPTAAAPATENPPLPPPPPIEWAKMPGDRSPIVVMFVVLATVAVPALLPGPPLPPMAKPIEA